jgi:hypothetical protein
MGHIKKHFILIIRNIILNCRTMLFYFPRRNYFLSDYVLNFINNQQPLVLFVTFKFCKQMFFIFNFNIFAYTSYKLINLNHLIFFCYFISWLNI